MVNVDAPTISQGRRSFWLRFFTATIRSRTEQTIMLSVMTTIIKKMDKNFLFPAIRNKILISHYFGNNQDLKIYLIND